MSGTRKCPKCGKELMDDMLICGYCGEKLPVLDQNETTEQAPSEEQVSKDMGNSELSSKTEKKRSSGKVIVGIAALIVVAVVAFFAYKNSAPGKYSSAVKAMESEDYEKASTILKEISDHKDSQDLYSQCILELGKASMEDGNYQEAIDYLTSIPEYENSKELCKQCIYELGKASMKEEKYQEAKDYFNSIAEFEDSKALIQECDHLTDVMNDKEAPIISGLDENVHIQCGTPYNIKDYIKEHIEISDNVTTEITDYDVNSDSDAYEKGSGKIDTRDVHEFVVEVTTKDEAGNEASAKINVTTDPIHITRDNRTPVIYDGEYGTVKFMRLVHDSQFGSPAYRFLFECTNKTDATVEYYFGTDFLTINNYQVTYYYSGSDTVAAGKTKQLEFLIYDKDIPEGVGDYNEIQSAFCMKHDEDESSFYRIAVLFDTNAVE